MRRGAIHLLLFASILLLLHAGIVVSQLPPAGAPAPFFSPAPSPELTNPDALAPAPGPSSGAFPSPSILESPFSSPAPSPSDGSNSDDSDFFPPLSSPPLSPPTAASAENQPVDRASTGGSSGISGGVKAGIAFGVIGSVFFLVGGGYIYVTRRNNEKRAAGPGRMRF